MKKAIGSILFIGLLLMFVHSVFADIEYPAGLKQEIRHYPHSIILQTLDVPGTTMAILQVSDQFSEITKFYRNELNKRRWKIITETKQKNRFTILAEKDTNSLIIDAGPDQINGKFKVSITLSTKYF